MKTNMNLQWKKWFVVAGVLGGAVAAHADIKYTKEITMGDNSQYKTVQMRAVKPNFERYESRSDMGVYKTEDITIRECGKKGMTKINPDLKIYAFAPDYTGASSSVAPGAAKPDANSGKPTTGKMTMTYAVKDLGTEEVAGFMTRHYMVDLKTESSGCAGSGTNNLKYEIWVSDIRQPNPCPNDATVTSVSEAMSRPDCKIEVVQLGDFKAYMEIQNGLVLRQKMYSGDKVVMIEEVTSLSQAKLGDELFVIPADYKKVSSEEFDKLKSDAMMKAMMGANGNG